MTNTSSTCSSSQSQTGPRTDRFKCLRKFCRSSRSKTSQTCAPSLGVISRHRRSTSTQKLEPGHPVVSTNYPASENDSGDQTDAEFCRDFTSHVPEQFCKTRTRDSKSKISGIRHFGKRRNCFARRTPVIPCNSYYGR
ncbi:uncharacterized protein LOC105688279 [Athalia rosae]|uniref:uncharacterized protein LOC105688279 n=1 Tax=Athalia rosae TaxID=37344 RepID=UPI002033498F|nr:uncharacterized protein LOC105688279 [Athalia rosae]